MNPPLRHLLGLRGIEEKTVREILELARRYKAERKTISWRPLSGQTWALIFMKSSTRTRVSFEVGVRELAGTRFSSTPTSCNWAGASRSRTRRE